MINVNSLSAIGEVGTDCNKQRGDMDERIRVDTDELKNQAIDFETSAGVFARAGKEILTFAAGLPSYDGQLSAPARAAALEINRQCQNLHSSYGSGAESLAKTAQAFEEVDKQTIDMLTDQQTDILIYNKEILSTQGPSTPVKAGGRKDVISYEDYGDYVIFWKNSKSIAIYKTDQNRALIQQYEKDVDEFCSLCADIFRIIQDMVMQSLALLPAIIMYLGLQGSTIIDYLKTTFPEFKGILESVDKLMGLLGLDAQDMLKKWGVNIPAFDPLKFGDDTKKLGEDADKANADYADAAKIWDELANSTP
jgi:hypothetical protein